MSEFSRLGDEKSKVRALESDEGTHAVPTSGAVPPIRRKRLPFCSKKEMGHISDVGCLPSVPEAMGINPCATKQIGK